jgi:hypothetical protein
MAPLHTTPWNKKQERREEEVLRERKIARKVGKRRNVKRPFIVARHYALFF